MMLTYDRAHELFSYNPETGVVIRKISTKKSKVGDLVGTPSKVSNSKKGYSRLVVTVDYKVYLLHRIVWLMNYGFWPMGQIDHIDQNPANNKISNLRDVAGRENQRNLPLRMTSTSGVTGVYWEKKRLKWRASVNVGGKRHDCGFFDDIALAEFAVKAKRAELGFHENHGKAH